MSPDHPEHRVGERNLNAWDKAGMAKRVNQARLRARLEHTPEATAVAEEMEINYREQVQKQYDQAALAEDMGSRLAERTDIPNPDRFLERLNELGKFKPGTPEFTKRYLRGSAAPEPVMYVNTPGPAEGQMSQQRCWAVDSDTLGPVGAEFGKRVGDPMTDMEYSIIRANQKPVNWDKDGEPTEWAPLHDSREFSEKDVLEMTEATPAERKAAKQYTVTGYIPENVGGEAPATEHAILPDPLPDDPRIGEDWDEHG